MYTSVSASSSRRCPIVSSACRSAERAHRSPSRGSSKKLHFVSIQNWLLLRSKARKSIPPNLRRDRVDLNRLSITNTRVRDFASQAVPMKALISISSLPFSKRALPLKGSSRFLISETQLWTSLLFPSLVGFTYGGGDRRRRPARVFFFIRVIHLSSAIL